MRWIRIILTVVCLAAIGWNLWLLGKRVQYTYSRPLTARLAGGMSNMAEMYAQAAALEGQTGSLRGNNGSGCHNGKTEGEAPTEERKQVSKNGCRFLKIGTWYPFNDPISVTQMNMVMAYYLYPALAYAATSATFGDLDFITGYRSHLCQLVPELAKAGLGNCEVRRFVDLVPGETKFFLLGHSAIRSEETNGGDGKNGRLGALIVASPAYSLTVTPSHCPTVTPPYHLPLRLARLLLALALPLPLGWLFLQAFFGLGFRDRRVALGCLHEACTPTEKHAGEGTGAPRRLEVALFAWVAGILLMVLLLPPLCLLGLPVTLGAFATFYVVTLGVCAGAWAWLKGLRFSGSTVRGAIFPTAVPTATLASAVTPSHRLTATLVILATLAWVGLLLAHVLAAPMADITGVGIWGLKAKAFVACGGVDRFLLTDASYGFCQQNYPLGFPLLLAWCHVWMGTYDDWAIRLVPMVLGMGVFGLLFVILRRQGLGRTWSGLLTLLFCSGAVFSQQSTFVQAETLLLLLGLTGAFFLVEWLRSPHGFTATLTDHQGMLWLGLLFLAGAAGVKQEGQVYFAVLATLAVWLKHKGAADPASKQRQAIDVLPKRRFHYFPAVAEIAAVVAVFALFMVPWQVWCRWQQLSLNDFSLTAACHRSPRVLLECWRDGLWAFGRQMFWTLNSTALIWVGGFGVLIWRWRKRDARVPGNTVTPPYYYISTPFLTGAALAVVLFFGTAYVLSVFVDVGRFAWHLQASERLLLFPTILFLVGTSMTRKPDLLLDGYPPREL